MTVVSENTLASAADFLYTDEVSSESRMQNQLRAVIETRATVGGKVLLRPASLWIKTRDTAQRESVNEALMGTSKGRNTLKFLSAVSLLFFSLELCHTINMFKSLLRGLAATLLWPSHLSDEHKVFSGLQSLITSEYYHFTEDHRRSIFK